jgi:hypothetical protein
MYNTRKSFVWPTDSPVHVSGLGSGAKIIHSTSPATSLRGKPQQYGQIIRLITSQRIAHVRRVLPVMAELWRCSIHDPAQYHNITITVP